MINPTDSPISESQELSQIFEPIIKDIYLLILEILKMVKSSGVQLNAHSVHNYSLALCNS